MFNEVCELVAVSSSINALGDKVNTETKRQVFCRVKSATYKDKEQAKAEGFIPVYKIVLADYMDYQGEEFVDYSDRWGVSKRYKITDQYITDTSTEIELTISKGIE